LFIRLFYFCNFLHYLEYLFMTKVIRINSNNIHFNELIILLDDELNKRYGTVQEMYNEYNSFEFIETVIIAYSNDLPAGCGCFKKYDEQTIEIKRMFIKEEFRGQGLSKLILNELEQWGTQLEYKKAILETGIKQNEAIQLYSKSGYNRIENYGQYAEMPNSVCMMKVLT